MSSQTNVKEISHPASGIIGYMHELKIPEPGGILIFQLPRADRFISNAYTESVVKQLRDIAPDVKVIFVAADVNVYELCGEDAVMLRLKGII